MHSNLKLTEFSKNEIKTGGPQGHFVEKIDFFPHVWLWTYISEKVSSLEACRWNYQTNSIVNKYFFSMTICLSQLWNESTRSKSEKCINVWDSYMDLIRLTKPKVHWLADTYTVELRWKRWCILRLCEWSTHWHC